MLQIPEMTKKSLKNNCKRKLMIYSAKIIFFFAAIRFEHSSVSMIILIDLHSFIN